MKITKIIAAALCVVLASCMLAQPSIPAVPTCAETIAGLEQKKRENAAAIKEYEKQLETIKNNAEEQERYQTLLAEKITKQEDNLAIIRDQLTALESEIADSDATLSRLDVEIRANEYNLDKNLEYYKIRLRAMYIAGNDSVASVIVGSTDFYDMLAKTELVSRVAKSDTELLDSITADLATLSAQKAEADVERQELETTKLSFTEIETEYTNIYNALVEDNQKTADVISLLNTEKKQYEENIDEMNKLQKELDKEIKKLEEEIRRRQEELRKQQQQNNISYVYKGERFTWPVPGNSYISSGYGYRWGSLHAGVDIAGGGIMGRQVVAAASGVVIMASQTCTHNFGKHYNCGCGMSYGNYIVIDHGDDADGTSYSTLYGHLSTVEVSYGQEVKAGQRIGTVGSTGYSTGPHLHFETRVNNVRKNPMNFFSQYYTN